MLTVNNTGALMLFNGLWHGIPISELPTVNQNPLRFPLGRRAVISLLMGSGPSIAHPIPAILFMNDSLASWSVIKKAMREKK